MYGKPLLLFAVLLIASFITFSIFSGTIDFRQQLSQFLQQSSPSPSPSPSPFPAEAVLSAHPPCRSSSPLKVYMYDLPRRFNVGMIHLRDTNADQTPVTVRTLPPWPKRTGLSSQHSVEYWMMASLLYGGEVEGGEAVRVSDPDEMVLIRGNFLYIEFIAPFRA